MADAVNPYIRAVRWSLEHDQCWCHSDLHDIPDTHRRGCPFAQLPDVPVVPPVEVPCRVCGTATFVAIRCDRHGRVDLCLDCVGLFKRTCPLRGCAVPGV